ncbi:MAG TPA: DUF6771 family protein [Sphingomonadaceae bacterium]|jgi:hypothetical protein|nr:DUF6771 family protein [Sphingomonadaceae bacterium]
MKHEHLLREVGAVLQRAPQWARTDMSSTDTILRARAEDTLAAMIAASLAEADDCFADRRAQPPLPFDHPSLPLCG